jgi:replicative DNA helicase
MNEQAQNFTPDFEEKIIQAILSDTTYGEQIFEVLDQNLFDLKYIQKMTEIIKNYYLKYEAFPTLSLLDTICQQEITNAVLRKQCTEYLEKIKSKPLNGDSQYVKDKSLGFFRTQAVKNALLTEVVPRLGKENLEEIIPIIQNALNKGTNRDVGYEYNLDSENRFKQEVELKVPTKWKVLNEKLDGGFGAGRLVTLIGGSGVGKSSLLVNVGVGALLAADRPRTVVHYTLELGDMETARRYDAAITNVEINSVITQKTKILSILKSKLPEGSNLIIKEYPMKSASIQTIKAHISRLKLKGITPDIIIIDYGDLLSSTEAHREERFNTSSIWGDMKRLSQELKIPVITATQSNREGYNDDILTPDKVSEDFKKIMHSDIIITISRSHKILLAKNRQGRDGIVLGAKIDLAKCFIEIYEQPDEGSLQSLEEAIKTPKNDFDSIDSYLKKNFR